MLETKLRAKMVKDATKQGYFIRSVNDRFNSAYPDMRMSHIDYFPIDLELKILRVSESTLRHGHEVNSGIEKLQEIELRKMNEAGMRAVGLIYVELWKGFVFCNSMRFTPNKAAELVMIPHDSPILYKNILDYSDEFLQREGYRYHA